MRNLIPFFISIILYTFCCLVCQVSVYECSKGCYVDNLENYSKYFPTILRFMEIKSLKYCNFKSSRSINLGNSADALAENHEYCTKQYVRNKQTSEHDLNTPLQYDTLTQSDIVRNQYMTLPYPAVSEEKLKHEKIYYDTVYQTAMRKVPYTIHYGISFEALNHYLYKGRNTFRLVFKRYFEKL